MSRERIWPPVAALFTLGCFLLIVSSCVTFKRTEEGYVKYKPPGEETREAQPAPEPIEQPFKPVEESEKKEEAAPEEKEKGIVEKDVKDEDPVIAPTKTANSIPLITTLVLAPAPAVEGSDKRKASNSLVHKGRNATGQSNFDMAERHFEEAINVDPQNPYAYYFFAEARFLAGDYAQSTTLCDRSLSLFKNPEWKSRAYLLRAKNMSNMRYYQKAAEDCEKALKTDPSNSGARLLQMKLYE